MNLEQIREWEAKQRECLGEIRDGEVEVQCRRCGKIEYVVQGGNTHFEKRCYSCRRDIFIHNELTRLLGPLTVPDLPTDGKGNIIWD